MKKFLLLILGVAIIGGLFYFSTKKMPDETKTEGEAETVTAPAVSENDSLTTIDQELSATELEDFDQEIQALDKSINQL